MSTFTAKIIAELDTSNVTEKLEKIKSQKIDLQNVTVNNVELSKSSTATLSS